MMKLKHLTESLNKKYSLKENINKSVDEMTFDELLDTFWNINGMAACYDYGMEPDELDAYFKENPDELKYNVEEGMKYYE